MIDRKHFSRAPWEREISKTPYLENDHKVTRAEEL